MIASFSNCDPALRPAAEMAFKFASNFNLLFTTTKLNAVPASANPGCSLMVRMPGLVLDKILFKDIRHLLEIKRRSQSEISAPVLMVLTITLLLFILSAAAIAFRDCIIGESPATPIIKRLSRLYDPQSMYFVKL